MRWVCYLCVWARCRESKSTKNDKQNVTKNKKTHKMRYLFYVFGEGEGSDDGVEGN